MKVLKFGAVWCNGCLVMRPRWEEIEKENPWLVTEYYDFDEDKGRLPVFVFLDERGEEILRLSGEVEKEKLVETIEQNKEK